jgi:hypothetical protein
MLTILTRVHTFLVAQTAGARAVRIDHILHLLVRTVLFDFGAHLVFVRAFKLIAFVCRPISSVVAILCWIGSAAVVARIVTWIFAWLWFLIFARIG